MSDDKDSADDELGFDELVDELEQESEFQWEEDQLDAEDDEEETRPVVTFRIEDDLFAVSGEAVREIVGSTETSDLPGSPGHILGITVVRRQVVGVLSLRRFLMIESSTAPDAAPASRDPSVQQDEKSRMLIVETPHYTVGLDVDEVPGLEQWPESRLDPETIPDNMRQSTRRYARGTRRRGDTLCVYLDLETLLDDAAVSPT